MNRLLPSFPVALVSAALLAAASAQQTNETIELFRPAAWPAGRVPAEAAALPVVVNRALLDQLAAADPIRLALSADTIVEGVVSRIEKRSAARYSVFGRFEDDPEGFFIIVVEEDVAVGMFQLPSRLEAFRLGYVADGVHSIAPIDPTSFGECATEEVPAPGQPAAVVPGGPAPLLDPHAPPPDEEPAPPTDNGAGERDDDLRGGCPAPPRHFDAMIYYTPAARVEAGGTSAILAECQLAVDTTNQTYMNSGIPGRMALVFRGEISYSETNDVGTDRDRLRDPGDGIMDNVHGERNTYGADFVCLFVDGSDPDNCGIAYCLPPDSSWGFCVVQRGCASSNFSFPHEIGHLQGCAHNREDAGTGCNYYCDSYGHRFTGNTGFWRTVMSYNDDAGTFMRIGWFSNPLVNFDGVPTGASGDCDTSTNNAGTIFGTTPGREDWRNPRFEVWVDFGQPFPWDGTYQNPWPTLALGISGVYGGADTPLTQPRLIIKAGTSLETPTISKPMRIEACGGTVRIGG